MYSFNDFSQVYLCLLHDKFWIFAVFCTFANPIGFLAVCEIITIFKKRKHWSLAKDNNGYLQCKTTFFKDSLIVTVFSTKCKMWQNFITDIRHFHFYCLGSFEESYEAMHWPFYNKSQTKNENNSLENDSVFHVWSLWSLQSYCCLTCHNVFT